MAGYFNITLDTTAPAGVGVKINGDELRAVSENVTLSITCSDADTTNYKMKIWGDIVTSSGEMPGEDDVSWQSYSPTAAVELMSDESGQRTVYVKVRDDLYNESETVSDSIYLYTDTPEVNIIDGPNPAVITTRNDKTALNSIEAIALSVKTASMVAFTADKDISDIKVVVAANINSLNDFDTNALIPSSGSAIYIIGENDEKTALTGDNGLTVSGVSISAGTTVYVSIKGDDLITASPGDGVKIVKVFVKETDARWSV